MRGGWTMVASPARPAYIYARGVSPLWLARVRRLLTEHSSDEAFVEPTIDARAWRQLEQWANETAPVPVTPEARRMPRFRAVPAEAEGA